jgi:hypothetical protein
MIVLQRRLDAQLEPHISDEQAGFRKDRNTAQHILRQHLIQEQFRRAHWTPSGLPMVPDDDDEVRIVRNINLVTAGDRVNL